MLTSGDNRFLVATWRRAGSVALCDTLYNYLISLNKQPKPSWLTLHSEDMDIPKANINNVVYHTHFLEHIKALHHCTTMFLAIRNPSEVAISNLVATKTQYWHVYSEKYINKINKITNKNEHQQYALLETDNFKKHILFDVELNELNSMRNDCINWNDCAVDILLNSKYHLFNYNRWGNNISTYLNMFNISVDPAEIKIVKNPKKWEDYVSNSNDVRNWILSNTDDDNRRIERWEAIS